VSLMLNNRSNFGELEKLDGQTLVTLKEGNKTNVHFNRNVGPLQTCLKNHKRRVTYNEKTAAASIGLFNSALFFFSAPVIARGLTAIPLKKRKCYESIPNIFEISQIETKLEFVKSHSYINCCRLDRFGNKKD